MGSRMHIPPSPGPAADRSIWYRQDRRFSAIGVWAERDPGRGEDAEPLLIHHPAGGQGVIAVFDGAGGSGAAVAYEPPDGPPRTGAWVGSRVARTAVESWFRLDEAVPGPEAAESLHEHLSVLLQAMRPRRDSRIRAKMRRELPTTVAALSYTLTQERISCRALWAGDSRAYVLTPRNGLQAVTRDHTVETDALEQLCTDPPLLNVVSADRPFRIDFHALTLDAPCVLVCATDGFFGYVETPADFECRLLDTLAQARDEADWAHLLCEWAHAESGDDASLCAVALGFQSFDAIRRAFSERTGTMLNAYRPATRYDGFSLEYWRDRAWQTYRAGYERRMPPLPLEVP